MASPSESEDIPFEVWGEENIFFGLRRSDWCDDCLVTHDVWNVYGMTFNPMDAVLIGEAWDCDDEEDLEEDDE